LVRTGPGRRARRCVLAYECLRVCKVFCGRLGAGGRCPSCGEVVLVDELGVEA